MSNVRVSPEADRKIFELIDVVEADDVMDRKEPLLRRTVYELVDAVIEEKPASSAVTAALTEEEIIKHVKAVAENVSRELFPAIAERIIREEIAKLRNAEEPGEKN